LLQGKHFNSLSVALRLFSLRVLKGGIDGGKEGKRGKMEIWSKKYGLKNTGNWSLQTLKN